MESSTLQLLSTIGTAAVTLAVCAFVVVNGIAALVFVRTRDRDLVNRWTGRILAANLLIVGGGVGVPLATAVARAAVSTFTTNVQPKLELKHEALEQIPANQSALRSR